MPYRLYYLLRRVFCLKYYQDNDEDSMMRYQPYEDEYAAVPEFPLGSGALLIISVSSYVIFSRNPEKITNALDKCSKILVRQ